MPFCGLGSQGPWSALRYFAVTLIWTCWNSVTTYSIYRWSKNLDFTACLDLSVHRLHFFSLTWLLEIKVISLIMILTINYFKMYNISDWPAMVIMKQCNKNSSWFSEVTISSKTTIGVHTKVTGIVYYTVSLKNPLSSSNV